MKVASHSPSVIRHLEDPVVFRMNNGSLISLADELIGRWSLAEASRDGSHDSA